MSISWVKLAAAPVVAALMVVTLGAGCPGPETVANKPPTANAGADQTVAPGAAVTLNGSGTDPDGGALTFAWSQTSGTAVVLSSTTTASTSFTAPATPGALTFR